KPVVHTGWIVQVGALETEGEALQRIEAAKSNSRGLLSKADSFTEPVIAKDNKKLFRARFAGLERDQAEAVCRALRRPGIPCITARNYLLTKPLTKAREKSRAFSVSGRGNPPPAANLSSRICG